jgi:hypothetical protein
MDNKDTDRVQALRFANSGGREGLSLLAFGIRWVWEAFALGFFGNTTGVLSSLFSSEDQFFL